MIADALKRLTQHSAIYALGPAVHKAIGFVLLPLVTVYIGTTGNYGVTEMAAVTIAVAAQVLGINLLHGMTRFYKEYETEAERRALVLFRPPRMWGDAAVVDPLLADETNRFGERAKL